MIKRGFAISLLISNISVAFSQGPFAPPAGQHGSTAIHKDSSAIRGWATFAEVERGWLDVADTTMGVASAGSHEAPVGYSGLNGTVSLGDGGRATLRFNDFIYDGPGPDFAVFENSFDGLFLELAYVEVSSDGTNFYRFPSQSLTPDSVQVGTFDLLDATNIHNLAGKYRAGYGVPFDLSELDTITGLDVNAVTHVRIIDVVGTVDALHASYDAYGKRINDPYPTDFAAGGFDLDAVGVMHLMTDVEQPESTTAVRFVNPVKETVQLHFDGEIAGVAKVYDMTGALLHVATLQRQQSLHIPATDWPNGMYILQLSGDMQRTIKLIKQ